MIIILFFEILMNDSIEYFFLRNLTIGLILRDYFEPQEIPLVLGRIFEQRKLSGWKYRLGEGDQSKRERMKNREKKTEKKRGRERGRKPLTASGATLTPTRCLSNLYLPSDQNDQTQTNSPIPMADSQSYAAGTSTFFAPGFIRRWNILTVESQIEANFALGSVPARNATNFAQPSLNRDDELCGKHGDSHHEKY